jgi:hypothetical protein
MRSVTPLSASLLFLMGLPLLQELYMQRSKYQSFLRVEAMSATGFHSSLSE